MDNLLPGRFVLAFEQVLELLEGVSPVEMDFLSPLVEIGDCFVDGGLDAESTTVNEHFHLHLEAGVFVLHFVDFFWQSFLVPTLAVKGKRWFLVD
jgi:hypothetical protein